MITFKSSDKISLSLELVDYEVKFPKEDIIDRKGNLMVTEEHDEDFQDTLRIGTHSKVPRRWV